MFHFLYTQNAHNVNNTITTVKKCLPSLIVNPRFLLSQHHSDPLHRLVSNVILSIAYSPVVTTSVAKLLIVQNLDTTIRMQLGVD